MTARYLTPMDSMFLYGETPQTMMHVGGLLPFTAAPDAPDDFLRRLMDEVRTSMVVQRPWNQKLKTPGFLMNPIHQWVDDDNFDIDYHVRRSALPAPGDERELGILVSRLHSHPLDLTRPPWEMHFIEGLAGNRWAIYIKVHHALVDGYTAVQMLANTLSPDPDSRSEVLFFAVPRRRRPKAEPVRRSPLADVGTVLGRALNVTKSVPDLAKSLVNLQLRRDGDFKELVSSYEAPHSILNSRIGRNRRFATQQYDLSRLTDIARTSGATLNDVVLAICGGGLRRFLGELGELGDKPLVGFLPVNVRPSGDVGGGNAVGAILSPVHGAGQGGPGPPAPGVRAGLQRPANGPSRDADPVRDDRGQDPYALHLQPLRVQRSRSAPAALLPGRPAGGRLPRLHSHSRYGAQHHLPQLCRHTVLRLHRRP